MYIDINQIENGEEHDKVWDMDDVGVTDEGNMNAIDKLKKWLISIKMEKYYHIFVQNGWNRLDVITEITEKSELKAAGIPKLSDQCLLMAEIRKLRTPVNADNV